tara:strand:- start:243 stop:575 length:333 start_codon:yes stop_codon:yes gene_type:complete
VGFFACGIMGKFKIISKEAEISESRNYPSLGFLSKCANFIAWFVVVLSLIAFFIWGANKYEPSMGELLVILIPILLFTFINFVFWRAISEILILFVHIAKDVREISLRKY